MRPSRRQADELRPISLERGFAPHAEGSCLIKSGNTHVLCTASLEERIPLWLRGAGKGWITAEYSMLPRATAQRTARETKQGVSGRTREIERLIGRSLRSVVNLEKLGERQIILDCDVIRADGGTRAAAITGAWVALHECIVGMMNAKLIAQNPIKSHVAAISCGIVGQEMLLDLEYAEDSIAETDANFVMTGEGNLVEIQASAEKNAFSTDSLIKLISLAQKGIQDLIRLQEMAVA